MVTRLDNYSYAWPDTEDWTLREVSLVLPQGECHCLSGASGAGKTTLALALKGLLPPGRQDGRLITAAAPGEGRAAVGVVLQNPETQILAETVGAEVAFGLENLCLPPGQMAARVRAALDAVGLELAFEHTTSHLSMGQKYRLLLAAQLVMQPALLILDEPAGQLDEGGLQSLAKIIAHQKANGLAVLLCEHRPVPLQAVIDKHWHLDAAGRLQTGSNGKPSIPSSQPAKERFDNAHPVVEVQGLRVHADDATPAWREVDLQLQAGQRALLCAPNGAGKTTLLRCLAGLLRPAQGSIRVCGQQLGKDHVNRIGYLFQNPRRQLFETTVFAEVAFSLRRQGLRREKLSARVNSTLARCHIAHLSGRSPHQLSYGQQHLVALASVLAKEPDLLLLDDPLAGLDPKAAAMVMAILIETSEQQGTTLLWTSHHQPELGDRNHVRYGIEGGRLVQY